MGLLKSIRLKVIGYTDEEIMSMMSSIKMSDDVLNQYKQCIKSNKYLDKRTLEIKLKRNVIVSKDVQVDRNGREKIVHYGNLTIILLQDEVIKVFNRFGKPNRRLNIDKKLKERINDLYWI